jgi:hypothetical protein
MSGVQIVGLDLNRRTSMHWGEGVYRPARDTDVRDATDPADLLRIGRLPPSWIASVEVRELRHQSQAARHVF